MQNLNLVDESFDDNFTDSYQIAIETDLKGLSYCILDKRVNKYVMLRHFNIGDFVDHIALEKIEDLINTEPLFSKSFKTASFIFKSPKNALIPDDFFNTNDIKTIYEFQNTLDELDELHYYSFEQYKATLIYTLPSRLADIVKRKMPRIILLHENIILLNEIFNSVSKDDVFVMVSGNYFTVAILKLSQLIFFNTFSYHAASDILFYLLGITALQGLKPETLKMALSGTLEKESQSVGMLKNVFKNLRFIKGTAEFEYSYKFSQTEPHVFANLFNALLCEL